MKRILLLLVFISFSTLASSPEFFAVTKNWQEWGYRSQREAEVAYTAAVRACYEQSTKRDKYLSMYARQLDDQDELTLQDCRRAARSSVADALRWVD
ncbi:hypothetical protein ACPV5V_19885, partial [Vibrio campbellii]